MVDIINAFAVHYDSCTLLTGHFNPRNTSLHENVQVKMVIAYRRDSTLKRLLTWGGSFLQILFFVTFRPGKSDYFIVSNPPMAPWLAAVLRGRINILIYDVYPDAIVQQGMLKSTSWLIAAWRRINRYAYRRAGKVFTISEGMKRVLTQYVEEKKVEVIPIWTDNSFLKPVPKHQNSFAIQHGLQDKFIILYSGNLGNTHNVEVLVELAAAVTNEALFFLIIGEGEKKAALAQKIAELELENCRLLPWQNTEVLPLSLAAADLGVVTLSEHASQLSVPSKTFNLFSVGAPLLGIAGGNSELCHVVNKYEAGRCFRPDDLDGMIDFISDLYANRDLHRRYREKALAASLDFGPENAQSFLT